MDEKTTVIKLCPPAKPPPKKRGRKAWKPSYRERHHVKVMKAAGFTDEACARVMHVHLTTLLKHCAKELATGADEVNAKLSGKLFQKAFRGDTVALLFWHKTRHGWRETNRTEHTGADGGPIQHETITAEAEAFKQKIEAMAERSRIAVAAANDRVPEPAEEIDLKVNQRERAK